uniref:Amino acid transporter transmembrane domain-containing protein n=1 Tax=Zooxanthella nutricula TaxID=1333877 RepID=A0A7S2QCH7_9DINO
MLCATALQGIVDIPAFGGCDDYYILAVALFCFATTQLRTLRNTHALALVSLLTVFGMSALQVVAAFQYSDEQKVPAWWFGNPKVDTFEGVVEAMLGATTTVWAYVPAFLTVELAGCMARPLELRKSLALSGVLNVAVFLVVGLTVVAKWGYDIGDPVTLTKVGAWSEGSALSKALSACLLVGNVVSYMLDSVPLGRFCQRSWAPGFADTWSPASVARYALYTLPTWLFALLLSLAVPNLFVLLAFTTAFTVPWVTQIYPAVLYLALHSRANRSLLHSEGGERFAKLQPAERLGVLMILAVGCVSFVVCLAAAIGKVSFKDLRGPSQIGCDNWIIWKG